MPILTTAIMNLIVILAIGVIVGLGFRRYGRTWLSSKTAGLTGASDITYALVGIAGSFIGFHVVVILGLLPTPLMLYLGAIVGAILTVWLWRGR
ncbi:MAG: transglycosylase [Beijerinckiaceae bacterium]|nr:transglycosylase [Beijerinckiaceae bacterium]